WYVVEADNKRSARINCIANLLSQVPYVVRERPQLVLPERQPDEGYVRSERSTMRYVEDHASTLITG
ncbi:MAG: polyphosphate kinase 2, partial [Gaiella sp.]